MENGSFENQKLVQTAEIAAKTSETPSIEDQKAQRRIAIFASLIAVLVIVGVIFAVIALLQNGETTAKIRDIFIIFLALESLLIGLTLVILIVQLARLINLLQNEIKPILDSTNETANTLRGTIDFLSDHLTEPVMKLNEYVAAISEVGKFFRVAKKK